MSFVEWTGLGKESPTREMSIEEKLKLANDYADGVYDKPSNDLINSPAHYTAVPGIECVDVTRHFSYLRGNAIKYLWRADHKGTKAEDLRKAIKSIELELAGLQDTPSLPPEPVPKRVSGESGTSAYPPGRGRYHGERLGPWVWNIGYSKWFPSPHYVM